MNAPQEKPIALAVFITSHGFGHAARSAAIMNALYERIPNLQFEIYTQVDPWVFEDTLTGSFRCHHTWTDVGVVQHSAMEEDLPATLAALQEHYPLKPEVVQQLSKQVLAARCRAVICDISPLGIAVAKQAGLPSYLVENFTWDWIYEGYLNREKRLAQVIPYLQRLFDQATYRIQTTPFCKADPDASLVSPVVSRQPKTSPRELRRKMGIPENAHMALITTGGIETHHSFLDRLKSVRELYFVVPGAAESFTCDQNLILLPHHTPFYHPDLVNGANVVIGKVGYSTMAEVYWAGIPFVYVTRKNFREPEEMARFIEERIPGYEITQEEFERGDWAEDLLDLIALPRIRRDGENGSRQIARYIQQTMRLGR